MNLHEGQPKQSEISILPNFKRYDAILVNLPVNFQQGLSNDGQEPSHGLGRIAAAANEKFWLNCGILDMQRNNWSLERVLQAIKENKPITVGINPTCLNIETAIEFTNRVSEMGIACVAGGYFPTLNPNKAEQVLGKCTAIVRGHGELSFGLITSILKDGYIEDIDQVKGAFRPNSGKNIYEWSAALSPNDLPIFDQGEYFTEPIQTHQGKKEISLYETDGCPFECGFCSSPAISQRNYHRPTIKRIVDDVENGLRLGADRIHFLDDLILIKPQHVDEFLSEISERDMVGSFDWRGMHRANILDKWDNETIGKLKQTGCYQLAFGVESGSPRILSMIKKRVTVPQVMETVKRLADFNIRSKAFFIMGFPTETEDEIKQTTDLIMGMKENGLSDIDIFEYHPYPGSYLWDLIQQNNPEVLDRLDYVGEVYGTVRDKPANKLLKTSVWLPDDVQIAQVPSSVVRQYILSVYQKFYE